MRDEREHPPVGELVSEVANFTVGLGMIVMIGFPFALPFILLTAVLAVPMVAIGVVAGLLVAPLLLVRRLMRRRRQDPESSAHRPATEPLRTLHPSH